MTDFFSVPRAALALTVSLGLALSGSGTLAAALPQVLERQLPSVVIQIPSLSLPAEGPQRGTGSVLVLARAGDTGQAIADSYGVDLSALSPLRAGLLPWGAVIRVALKDSQLDSRGQLPPGVQAYLVRSGDTLASIAYRHDLSVPELLSANLSRPTLDELAVGDLIYIPPTAGLMLRIKPGQTVTGLVASYGASAHEVARANGIGLPNELGVGDYLLLPGVIANGYQQELLVRRERQTEARRLARVQEQYLRYLAYEQSVQAKKLEQQYATQEQYERAQAYRNSPARKALIEQYEAQARFEAAQQTAKRQAQVLASVPQTSGQRSGRTSGRVRTTSTGSGSGLAWPMRSYQITSRFGEADIEFHRQYFHGGVDLAGPYGTPIYAAAGGTVTESGFGAYGKNVYTDTGDALMIYGHMSRTAVSVGQRVRQGELLGYVGCSGMCTGPHLHFEVRLGGQPVNPLGLLP